MGDEDAAPRTDRADPVYNVQDSTRFYCPYPGCNRSFVELWRLKVHHRAKPGVRGSGQERGHGTELRMCPKCGVKLAAGKHHVNCAAGKSSKTYLRPKKEGKRAPAPGTKVVRTMRTRKAAEAVKAEETEDSETTHDDSEVVEQNERILKRLRRQDDAENWATKLLFAAALMNEEQHGDDQS